jgi:hypothetical protein
MKKLYFISKNDYFNGIESMREKLEVKKLDAFDAGDFDKIDVIENQIDEIQELDNRIEWEGFTAKAEWEVVKRVKELSQTRQSIRNGIVAKVNKNVLYFRY